MVSGQSHITLAVSIVVYDSDPAQLQALLESLLVALAVLPARDLQVKTDVNLVDNCEHQRLRKVDFSAIKKRLQSGMATLHLLSGHGNIGYGRGHNLVIQKDNHHYHLVLNPDVELAPDSLAIGLSYLERHPDVAVVSPFAESADGKKQYLCKRHPSLLVLFLRGFCPRRVRQLFNRRLAHYEMHDLPEHKPSSGIPFVSGCCMLCRADMLRQVRGFDDRYFLYFEDFDLSHRLSRLGKVVYLPDMRIRHYGGNAARKGLTHIARYTRSAWRFFNTWGWRFIQ